VHCLQLSVDRVLGNFAEFFLTCEHVILLEFGELSGHCAPQQTGFYCRIWGSQAVFVRRIKESIREYFRDCG
jgi:hypothetical protein